MSKNTPQLKTDKVLKLFYPILALVLVIFCTEISFKIFNDFNRVIPYEDYFSHKRNKVSHVSGELWSKKEYTSVLIRNEQFQHIPSSFDFANLDKKHIFLLGDSIVESGSMRVEDAFYSLVQKRNDQMNVFPFHYAGCSLKTLVLLMSQYKAFFQRDKKAFKPDLMVFQIRPFSYQGGNTNLFDARIGKARDFQDKLPSDSLKKPSVVKAKEKFLSNFKLDIKFSSKFKDQLFRKAVMSDSRIVSLIAWRLFQWTSRVTAQAPNHEGFIVNTGLKENEYWLRFEKTIKLLKTYSKQLDIPVAVLLVPSPEWITEYQYTGKLNSQEQKYKQLFEQYSIDFKYANEEFLQVENKEQKKVFWEDKHPNLSGSYALSLAFEKLLGQAFNEGDDT